MLICFVSLCFNNKYISNNLKKTVSLFYYLMYNIIYVLVLPFKFMVAYLIPDCCCLPTPMTLAIDYGLNHEKNDSVFIYSKLGFCVLFCRYIYKKQF